MISSVSTMRLQTPQPPFEYYYMYHTDILQNHDNNLGKKLRITISLPFRIAIRRGVRY